MNKKIFLILFFIFLMAIANADAVANDAQVRDKKPITYLSYVDDQLGFYKVLDITTFNPSSYDNRTLIINLGDTVVWMNDADKDVILTVVSDQQLFDNKMMSVRQRSGFTFNEIGTFSFYIRENKTKRQTIIVGPIGVSPTEIPTSTITTPIQTPIQTTVTPKQTTVTPIQTLTVPGYADIDKPTPTPVSTIPPIQYSSPIRFMSIIVVMISLFITYKVGKNG